MCCCRCGALHARFARRAACYWPRLRPLRARCAPAARAARPPRRGAARHRLCARGGSTAACTLSVEVTALEQQFVSWLWVPSSRALAPRCATQPPRSTVRSRSHRGAQARRTPAAGARHRTRTARPRHCISPCWRRRLAHAPDRRCRRSARRRLASTRAPRSLAGTHAAPVGPWPHQTTASHDLTSRPPAPPRRRTHHASCRATRSS